MVFPSGLIEEAVNAFCKLPGVGKKSAMRHVLHLLKKDESDVVAFAQAIQKMRSDTQYCTTCHNISDSEQCNICASATRQQHTICVVENIRDVIAIENTQQYNGTYHVLGALISPLDGVGPEQLYIESLLSRVQNGDVKEIIMALSPNINGDTTSYFIQKKLAPHSVKITTISRGVAFGAELEYTDEMTLARSIQHRLPVQENA